VGAAEGIRVVEVTLDFFRQAEVGQLDVAVVAQKDVLRLQVSIEDTLAVEVVDGQSYLADVDPRLHLGEATSPLFLLNSLHGATRAVLEDEEQLLLVLETLLQLDNVRVAGDLLENALLRLCELQNLEFVDHGLLLDLHRVLLLGLDVFALKHLAERSLAYEV